MADDEHINENKHLIIPSDILPDIIPIIPISQRPIFPGMMIPLVLTGDKMIATAKEIVESESKTCGVVLIKNQREGPLVTDDLYTVGTSVKVIKATPIDEKTVQLMINAVHRFRLERGGARGGAAPDCPRALRYARGDCARRAVPGLR